MNTRKTTMEMRNDKGQFAHVRKFCIIQANSKGKIKKNH